MKGALRNWPCECGSGRKAKTCHGRAKDAVFTERDMLIAHIDALQEHEYRIRAGRRSSRTSLMQATLIAQLLVPPHGRP